MADPLFDQFWASYPRKVAKLTAMKAWKQLKVTPELAAQIQAALTWQRQVWTDPQYTPHPASYLRAGRWMDEPPQAQPQGDQEWVSLVQRVGKARGVM